MVGEGQIVVDGLGHTQKLLLMPLHDGIIGQLLDGIHGIVSSDINEGFDVQLVQNLENLLVDLTVLMDLRKLEPAGAKECGRSSLQQLDVHVGMDLSGQIHILLVQKALNSVKHSVNLVEASLSGRLIDACQTGIDHGSGAARLSYNDVAFLCHF